MNHSTVKGRRIGALLCVLSALGTFAILACTAYWACEALESWGVL